MFYILSHIFNISFSHLLEEYVVSLHPSSLGGFRLCCHYFLKVCFSCMFSHSSFGTSGYPLASLTVFNKLQTYPHPLVYFRLDPTCGPSWSQFLFIAFSVDCMSCSYVDILKPYPRYWCICRDAGFCLPFSDVCQALFWEAFNLLRLGSRFLVLQGGLSCSCCLSAPPPIP